MNVLPRRTDRPRWLALAAALLIAGSVTALAQQADNVQPVDKAGLKRALKEQRGKNVVVLNLWATWCAPCVAEFPDLVKLHETYQDRGLTVIAFSLDEPQNASAVDEFILKQKATFPVLLRSPKVKDPFAVVETFDKKWQGLVPTTYVIGKNGKRIGEPLMGLQTYEQFEAAVLPHLDPPAEADAPAE